jgi:hypothetical protein
MNIVAMKPCVGECMILSMAASLEYDDGRRADVSNGVCISDVIQNSTEKHKLR